MDGGNVTKVQFSIKEKHGYFKTYPLGGSQSPQNGFTK
jgi:hypothetical protein